MDTNKNFEDTNSLSNSCTLKSGADLHGSGNNNGEISLRQLILQLMDIWKYLLSKWMFIMIAGLIGAGLGFVYAFSKKTIYKAELTFALEDEKPGGLGGQLALVSQFGFDLGGNAGGAFSGDNLIELMKSRLMVEKSLLAPVKIKGKVQTLAELFVDFNNLRQSWSKNPRLKNIQFLPGTDRSNFSLQQDSILGSFYKDIVTNNLSVDKKDKRLSLIVVRVKSTNELFSKYFSDILTKEVSDFYVETKTKKSAQNFAILQFQTDSVRKALNSAISGVAYSVDANPNANPARQILKVPSQRRQVDVQANQATLTELVKNLELSKVTLRKETPLIQIIDKPILPLDREKFGKLKGLILGGFFGCFLMVLVFIIKRLFKNVMA